MSYIPGTKEEQLSMLADIGYSSFDELFSNINDKIKLQKPLNIPTGKSEFEALELLEELADKNKVYKKIFRGAGSYDHYKPSVVTHLASRAEYLTAYTPYQPEMSQGILQTIFEYQTTVCRLTGMDVSNAGVYDGAHAAAEAFAMCRNKKRNKLIAFDNIKPNTLAVLRTYAKSANAVLEILACNEGLCDLDLLKKTVDMSSACVYVETPNFFGLLENASDAAAIAHEAGAMFIIGGNPISYGVLKTPGEQGADIAVGEAQPLGMPLSFGGPYLGYMAAKAELMRSLPGRIAGQTVDTQGRRAFVLTLQTREQHIRRDKANSSICSNEALCAVTAAIYCAALGKQGFYEVSKACFDNAHYLCSELTSIKGFELKYKSEFFNEFVTVCPASAEKINQKLSENGILGGLPLEGNSILWCATEKNSKSDIDALVSLVKEVTNNE